MADKKKPRGSRRVKLRMPDWDSPRMFVLKKNQFDMDGAKRPLVILRALATHPHSWWTRFEVEKCTRRRFYRGAFRTAFWHCQLRGLIDECRNPIWDPKRFREPGNPKMLYRISRRGLSLVSLTE